MKCYTPDQTPVLSELARSFAVCDHYHCSVPSQTIPNRDFVHAATSTGHVNNGPVAQCEAKTVFNQIQDAIDAGRKDLSWGIFGNNPFASGKDKEGKFGGDHFSLTRLIMTELHDAKLNDNFGTLDDFAAKCKSGDLPSYSFPRAELRRPRSETTNILPATSVPASSLWPTSTTWSKRRRRSRTRCLSSPMTNMAAVTTTCRRPEAPKAPDPGKPPGQDGFLFNRFGVRVPCVVVNPYIEKGLIARPAGYVPFDHTSIIKTIQQCFQLEGSLTERDKAAPDFSGLLTRDAPRTDDIPVVNPLKWDVKASLAHLNDLHRVIGKVSKI